MSDRATQIRENKTEGSQFEYLFEKAAKLQGFGVKKNKLSCDIIGPGVYRPLHSELDWTLVDPRVDGGRISFVDSKCFADEFFPHSALKEHQIKTANWFNDFGVTAGFAVWFKPVNRIVYFSGKKISFFGQGNRFTYRDGTLLGKIESFDIRKIYEAR